ncbi:MAG: DUF1049 domain-containing protein [Gammaproteobacteria bacterium]|jgi:uncharacterized membrane protein YciS (DUF1049 family)|nr:DUF1049 domain-containing protein [Gammaproteobacteria bacterium]
MFRWFLIVLVLLAAAAGLVVGVLNAEPVSLDLIALEVSLPLGGLVLLALALGVLVGLLMAWLLFFLPGRIRRSGESRKRRKGTELTDRQHG